MKRLHACLIIFAVGLTGCRDRGGPAEPVPVAAETAALPSDIEAQVHSFCGAACHAYPPAESFPRHHWRAEVERGYRFFDKSGLALTPPKLGHVIRYYEERSPEDYPPATITPAAHPLSVEFEKLSYPAPAAAERPMISHLQAVRLSTPGSADALTLLASDMQAGRILALNPRDSSPAWKELAKVPNPAHAEVVDLDGDGILDILVADLGSFPPTDRRCGSVVWLRGKRDGTFEPVTLLANVGRVADVRAADFRGTGKLDLVVAVFGLHDTGEILFLENRTADWAKPEFAPHVLDARHGAIHVPVTDLNGDGRPDFVALISQEHEVVVGFLNEGGGRFAKKTLYAAPHPGWGISGIELVDMNGDGRLDVLYTNGDILDEPYLWKPYHGVQWLENTRRSEVRAPADRGHVRRAPCRRREGDRERRCPTSWRSASCRPTSSPIGPCGRPTRWCSSSRSRRASSSGTHWRPRRATRSSARPRTCTEPVESIWSSGTSALRRRRTRSPSGRIAASDVEARIAHRTERGCACCLLAVFLRPGGHASSVVVLGECGVCRPVVGVEVHGREEPLHRDLLPAGSREDHAHLVVQARVERMLREFAARQFAEPFIPFLHLFRPGELSLCLFHLPLLLEGLEEKPVRLVVVRQ